MSTGKQVKCVDKEYETLWDVKADCYNKIIIFLEKINIKRDKIKDFIILLNKFEEASNKWSIYKKF